MPELQVLKRRIPVPDGRFEAMLETFVMRHPWLSMCATIGCIACMVLAGVGVHWAMIVFLSILLLGGAIGAWRTVVFWLKRRNVLHTSAEVEEADAKTEARVAAVFAKRR